MGLKPTTLYTLDRVLYQLSYRDVHVNTGYVFKAQQSSAKTTTIQKSVKLSQQEIEWLQKSVSSERQRYIHNTGGKATAGQNSTGGEQERDLREQSRTHRAETGKTFQDQYLYIIQIEIHLFYGNCLNISYINYI